MNFKKQEGRIYLEDKDMNIIAEIKYRKVDEETYDIYHTFVDETLRGQGVASKLVELAAKEIENRGAKVIATCSYAKKWLEKNK